MRPADWDAALDDHRAALAEFAARAGAIAGDRWDLPRAPGKWSPAQETMHLVLFFRMGAQELRGGAPPQLRARPWQRRLFRWFLLPRILRRARLPLGVRAPREARPPEHPGERPRLLDDMRAAAGDFERALEDARGRRPQPRLTHPYFGPIRLDDALRFAAVHTRHHAALLPSP